MKNLALRRAAFVRMLSGGVAIQAALSASNFIVGLLLVRRTPDAQYGYYVLVTTVVLLAAILQGAFIQPPMVIRFTRSNTEERANLVGGLLRDQRRLMPIVPAISAVIMLVLLLAGKLTLPMSAIIVGGTLAVIAAMQREFFRMVLFIYQRPNDVLRCDLVYCACLLSGAFLSTLSAFSAAATALTLAISALISGTLLARALWRHAPWNPRAPLGKLREIAHEGAWSSFGGGVHWLFSQGYNYVVAGTLDVTAVAALAATRLLVMPVGLLSSGVGTLMLPTVSKWTDQHNARKILVRLALFAAALAAAAGCYLVIMWLARDWIFEHLLKKHFADRDHLLGIWVFICLVTIFRDQMLYFLIARARFRLTAMITLCSAIVSFAVSFVAMRRMGVIGALLGLLVGEMLNVAGIIAFSLREARTNPDA